MSKAGRPKSDNPKTHIITFRMNDEDYKKLKAYTERYNLTISEFMQQAIEIRYRMDS